MAAKKTAKKAVERSGIGTINLRNLDYSPDKNPLLEPSTVELKKWTVRSGTQKELLDPETGEVSAAAVIHTIEEKDPEDFVKVFTKGVAASYELNQTAQRVFTAIMIEYENTPMSGGYADTIYLAWFDGGLSGHEIGMSEKTFQRGLKQLLEKNFLSPRSPNRYWVNPSMFFKGNRATLIREYRRTASKKSGEVETELLPKK